MDSKPSALAIAQFLQKDRKVLDERAWVSNARFERKSTEKFAILVRNGGGQLPLEHAELLGKILSAINIDAGNIELIDLDLHNGLNLVSIRKADFERLISFGVSPKEIGLHTFVQPYHALKWLGVQLLFADTIAEIAASTDRKKALWGSLKQNFL